MSAASYFPLHHLIKISIPECLEKRVIRLKLGIKIYFPRRLKNWLGVFYNFLPSLICLVLPLPLLVISSTLALWKNRTATARRKQIKPFSEMLTALWLLWNLKIQAISILLCLLDSQKWWAQSVQTMPVALAWRSDDKVMVWAILQNKSPFHQEENIYLSLDLI